MLELERITAHRRELGAPAGELAEQLAGPGKVGTHPTWVTALVRAPLVLTNREVSRGPTISSKASAHDQHEPPNPTHTRPVTSNFTVHTAQCHQTTDPRQATTNGCAPLG